MALSIDQRTHRFEGTQIEMPYRFVSLDREEVGPPLLYLNGYAEGDRSTQSLFEDIASETEVNPIALKVDFSKLKDRGTFGSKLAAVERVGKELVPTAMEHFAEEHGVAPIASNSLGALMAGFAIDETLGQYTGNALSVNGMGLSVDSETGRVYRNRTSFLAHYAIALVSGSKPKGEENYWNATTDATKTIARDLVVSRTFPAQLTMANTTDIISAYVEHASRGNTVLIHAGKKDKLFKFQKVAFNIINENTPPTLDYKSIENLPHQDAGLNATRAAIVSGIIELVK